MVIPEQPRSVGANAPLAIRFDVVANAGLSGSLAISTVELDIQGATVQLVGELDITGAASLAIVVDRQAASGRRAVRLDLSGLTFCDCAGLRAIVEAHNRMRRADGTLVLIGANDQFRRLLRTSHLDEALLVADESDGVPRRRSVCTTPDQRP